MHCSFSAAAQSFLSSHKATTHVGEVALAFYLPKLIWTLHANVEVEAYIQSGALGTPLLSPTIITQNTRPIYPLVALQVKGSIPIFSLL